MTGRILPLRSLPRRTFGGVVHVMGDQEAGFEVAHESASGNSWGGFTWYRTGQEAITAAYALNRDTYYGGCDVFVCDAALQDRDPEPSAPHSREDF